MHSPQLLAVALHDGHTKAAGLTQTPETSWRAHAGPHEGVEAWTLSTVCGPSLNAAAQAQYAHQPVQQRLAEVASACSTSHFRVSMGILEIAKALLCSIAGASSVYIKTE